MNKTPSTNGATQSDAAAVPCPTCSAPCKPAVHSRGGEWGWGTTDAQRTTYRYAAPPAGPAVDALRLSKAVLDFRSYIGARRPDDVDDAQAWDDLTAAAAALAGHVPQVAEMQRCRVRFARVGIVEMLADCSYFGPHMIGEGDELLVWNLTKNPLALTPQEPTR
jgi:hypothetical protein